MEKQRFLSPKLGSNPLQDSSSLKARMKSLDPESIIQEKINLKIKRNSSSSDKELQFHNSIRNQDFHKNIHILDQELQNNNNNPQSLKSSLETNKLSKRNRHISHSVVDFNKKLNIAAVKKILESGSRKKYFRLNSDRESSKKGDSEGSNLYKKLIRNVRNHSKGSLSHNNQLDSSNNLSEKFLGYENNNKNYDEIGNFQRLNSLFEEEITSKNYKILRDGFNLERQSDEDDYAILTQNTISNRNNVEDVFCFQPLLTSSITPKIFKMEVASQSYDTENFKNLYKEDTRKSKSRLRERSNSKSSSVKKLEDLNFEKKSSGNNLNFLFQDSPKKSSKRNFNPFMSYSKIQEKFNIKSTPKNEKYRQEYLKRYQSTRITNRNSADITKTSQYQSSKSYNKGKKENQMKKQLLQENKKTEKILSLIHRSRSKSKDMTSRRDNLITSIIRKLEKSHEKEGNTRSDLTKNLEDVKKKLIESPQKEIDATFDDKIVQLFDQLLKENEKLNDQLKKQYSYRDRILTSFSMLKEKWKEDRETRSNYILLKQQSIKSQHELEIYKQNYEQLILKIKGVENNLEDVKKENLKLREEVVRLKEGKGEKNSDDFVGKILEVSPEDEDESSEEVKSNENIIKEKENDVIQNFENDVLKTYINSQKEEFKSKEEEYQQEIV